LSNYKLWATIGDGIGSSWRFFRARVDYLHVSNNASHIFFSVQIIKRTSIENSIFNSAIQIEFLLGDFFLNACCKNELHDINNDSNEFDE
jgi:hypothetical protein